MEKKFFDAAEIEVVKLDMVDIIATSCTGMDIDPFDPDAKLEDGEDFD